MYICFYYFWNEINYEFFSNFDKFQNFFDSYKNDSHFTLLCSIHDRTLIYFDPVEFEISSRQAGDAYEK